MAEGVALTAMLAAGLLSWGERNAVARPLDRGEAQWSLGHLDHAPAGGRWPVDAPGSGPEAKQAAGSPQDVIVARIVEIYYQTAPGVFVSAALVAKGARATLQRFAALEPSGTNGQHPPDRLCWIPDTLGAVGAGDLIEIRLVAAQMATETRRPRARSVALRLVATGLVSGSSPTPGSASTPMQDPARAR
jgi:hypothetical protein